MTQAESGAIADRIQRLAPDRLREVIDFLEFIESKSDSEAFETMLASERSLANDWDTPEEDAAWAKL